MEPFLIYPTGTTAACSYAASELQHAGFTLTDHPSPEVTHLLLDVPSFSGDGMLRGGGEIQQILERLPPATEVIGGNLSHPALSQHPCFDLLKDPGYLAQNAAITAECALGIAFPLLKTTLSDTQTVVIGWGRIGKCLTKLLSALGCPVTVAARNPHDRAMISALGFPAAELQELPELLVNARLLFNTVPAPVVSSEALDRYKACVPIDLASVPGLEGSRVIYARGLPGQYAPESSGKLIAGIILKKWKEEGI